MSVFEIGQPVFIARYAPIERWIACSDCRGLKWLTVILGDDSSVTIDCVGCADGYAPPRGVIRTCDYEPQVDAIVVDNIEMREGAIRYNYNDSINVFDNEEAAWVRARALKHIADKEETERLLNKEQPKREWSWHVHYHRRCVKQAEKEIAYHSSKLEAAKLHSKEEKGKS